MLWRGGGALKSDAALRVLRHIMGIATKRNGSKGIFGSHSILDDHRSGKEATRFPALLQRLSNACRAGRAHAGTEPWRRSLTCKFQVISMAAALSRTLSDANSGMKLCSGERQAREKD